MLANQLRHHLGVRIRLLFPAVSFQLPVARRNHPLAHRFRALRRRRRPQFLVLHRRHLNMDIDAIQQRPRDFRHVSLDTLAVLTPLAAPRRPPRFTPSSTPRIFTRGSCANSLSVRSLAWLFLSYSASSFSSLSFSSACTTRWSVSKSRSITPGPISTSSSSAAMTSFPISSKPSKATPLTKRAPSKPSSPPAIAPWPPPLPPTKPRQKTCSPAR